MQYTLRNKKSSVDWLVLIRTVIYEAHAMQVLVWSNQSGLAYNSWPNQKKRRGNIHPATDSLS